MKGEKQSKGVKTSKKAASASAMVDSEPPQRTPELPPEGPLGAADAQRAPRAEQTFVALDLGSNSFHMLIARAHDGVLEVVDRMKEPVRLAAGLDARGRLADGARKRALECLERFGQRVAHLPTEHVRAVGTNTLRRAKESGDFLEAAAEALGHPIEVVPGREEARLIYMGVAHSLFDESRRRLVIDIGGGSTEVILGEGFEALEMDSLYMGCVSYSLEHFPDGEINRTNLRSAEIAAGLELQSIQRRYLNRSWDVAVGASGTIQAIREILLANRWSDGGINIEGLRRLREAMLEAGSSDALVLEGMPAERRPVLVGGVAILYAIFEELGIDTMTVSTGALREGLLYDLIGRVRHVDVRDRTIRRLCERYKVDMEQASRVERVALAGLRKVATRWRLDEGLSRQMLAWAARLHEIGLAVAYSGYHKHGAYLLTWSDMPGFSREDKRILSVLVRNHRRRLRKSVFKTLGPKLAPRAIRVCVLLRLAVLLNRARGPAPPSVGFKARREALTVRFPEGWLAEHPLTAADLEQEQGYLEYVGIRLEIESGVVPKG